MSATLSSAQHRSSPSGTRIVAYYGDWNRSCSLCLPLQRAQLGRLSALNYAFANPAHDRCSLTGGPADARTDFPVLRAAKKKYPRLQVILSLGGGSLASAFPDAVATQSKISTLVAACMKLTRRTYPGVFDGIDIDWEGPSNATQEAHFTALIRAFRLALGPKAPLTVAVTPNYKINWKVVAPMLSWVNLMTYDLHGPWGDAVTDFLAPLRADPRDPEYEASNSASANAAVMVSKFGVPASKILLGIPFYGRGYAGVRVRSHGLYQPYKGADKSGGDGVGSFYYCDLRAHYVGRHGYYVHGPDPYSGEVWLFKPGKKGGQFISFDNPSTIAAKSKLIRSMHLGGAMIWDIAFDTADPRTSLTSALYRDLKM
jgi:chitinase